jgi:hypothetical protein
LLCLFMYSSFAIVLHPLITCSIVSPFSPFVFYIHCFHYVF